MPLWTDNLRQRQQQISLLDLASSLQIPAAWRTFTEYHVFAVWDFMSLLKRLQREVTCGAMPWLPPANPQAARFINEMVLAEESDDDGAGRFSDHFSIYRRGMREAGADCSPMDNLLAGLQANQPWQKALAAAGAPLAAARFVTETLEVAERGAIHEVAASFLFGREALLPTLFAELLAALAKDTPQFETLRFYFSRHIELDGSEHGPMAEQLLASLCGGDANKRAQAEAAAAHALRARRELWHGIGMAVRNQ